MGVFEAGISAARPSFQGSLQPVPLDDPQDSTDLWLSSPCREQALEPEPGQLLLQDPADHGSLDVHEEAVPLTPEHRWWEEGGYEGQRGALGRV